VWEEFIMRVYKNERAKEKIYETYERLLAMWAVDAEERDIASIYGTTHVVICGKESKPPLVLFHGVGDDSALMWIYNAKELAEHFRIYAIDTIGGPGKSCPNENYNKDFDEIKWLDELFAGLGLERFYAAGVSNGSYMTQHYGIMRPDKVIKMICMSGSISVKEGGSPLITMMKVFLPEALFPTKKNTEKLIKKMMGSNSRVFTENPALMEHFACLLKGFNNMSMANHKILYFSGEQLSIIRDKTIFLLGEADPLGDVEKTKSRLESYQMNYRFFHAVGHGINHEISEEINNIIIKYFSGQIA
jgi:pimeloyl-ACP methyl ester carboxylesterase